MSAQTERIQLWTGGPTWHPATTAHYQGDANGPQLLVKLGQEEEFREATVAERKAIRVEEIVQNLIRNDVLSCDSSLIDKLTEMAQAADDDGHDLWGQFIRDKMQNLRPQPYSMDEDDCRQWLNEHTQDDDNFDGYSLAELRETIEDRAQDAEVFEWWRVTEYLGKRLAEIGEVVLDNDYGCWWGRCTTGQGMECDGVLQNVAAGILR